MPSYGMKENIPSGYRKGTVQQFTPDQMKLLKNSMRHVGPNSFLSRLAGGDESMFAEMEAPALRQFQGLQGQMASRFSQGGGGPGALGARHSSGFQNYANQATSDFAQQLQGQRMELRNQALRDLMSMSNELMGQRPYENFLVKKQQKQGFDWGGLAGGAAGATGGFFLGGPAGAATGASLGYNAGSGLF